MLRWLLHDFGGDGFPPLPVSLMLLGVSILELYLPHKSRGLSKEPLFKSWGVGFATPSKVGGVLFPVETSLKINPLQTDPSVMRWEFWTSPPWPEPCSNPTGFQLSDLLKVGMDGVC